MPCLNAPMTVTEEGPQYQATMDSCHVIRLSNTIIEDTMWEVARVSTSMAIALGGFFCVMMISTLYWESINMKPIAVGLLITYLFQSFSFFFFDSQLCREHSCSLSDGTIMSIVASFCWFVSAMVAILMDVHHTRKLRRLARLERRRLRRLRKKKLQRESSTTTTETNSSNGSSLHAREDGLVESEQPADDTVEIWQV